MKVERSYRNKIIYEVRMEVSSKDCTSKFISLIFRDKTEVIGITLDEHVWAQVDELIAGIAKSRGFQWICWKRLSGQIQSSAIPSMKTKI